MSFLPYLRSAMIRFPFTQMIEIDLDLSYLLVDLTQYFFPLLGNIPLGFMKN